MAIGSATFDDLVRGLYEAASGVQSWSDALGRIADAFESCCVQIVGVARPESLLRYSLQGGHLPPAARIDYLRTYHALNPWIAPALALRDGEWLHCHEHFDARFVARDRFYQEFLIPYGVRYLSGTKLVDADDLLVLFGMFRGVGQPPIEPARRPLLARLSGHLVGAIKVFERMRAEVPARLVGHEVLDAMAQPVLLVDQQGRLHYRNRAGAELLDRGHHVVARDGVLQCRVPRSHGALLHELARLEGRHAEASAPSAALVRAVLPIEGVHARETEAYLTRIDARRTLGAFGFGPMLMMMFRREDGSPRVDPAMIAEAFDLTPAEALVASQLAEGAAPAQIARSRGVALHTVRSQMRSVYAKLGVARQAELVRRLRDRFE